MNNDMNEQIKLSQDEESAISSALSVFLKSYLEKDTNISDGEWLLSQLTASLPEKDAEAVTQIRDIITGEISRNEELKSSLEAAQAKGMSREHWFSQRVKKATTVMNHAETGQCLESAYSALESVNSALSGNTSISEMQGGSFQKLLSDGQEWNEYTLKSASKKIVQSAGMAGIQGVIAGAKSEVERQLIEGEFDVGQFLENSLKSGGANIKAIVAGALETVLENGLLRSLPMGIPVEIAANISNIAVENINILSDVAVGNLTVLEGLEKAGDIVVETTCGVIESVFQQFGPEAGTTIGMFIGSFFSPIGTAIGAKVGQTLGKFAGNEVGQILIKGARKLYGFAKENILNPVAQVADSLFEGIKSFVSGLFA